MRSPSTPEDTFFSFVARKRSSINRRSSATPFFAVIVATLHISTTNGRCIFRLVVIRNIVDVRTSDYKATVPGGGCSRVLCSSSRFTVLAASPLDYINEIEIYS